MQRKASKKTRLINSAERKFILHVKQMSCCICNQPGPSIVDHVLGSSATIKHNFVKHLVGPWVLLPLCNEHDAIKTNGSHRQFVNVFGKHQIEFWLETFSNSGMVPSEIVSAVRYRLDNPI